MNENVQIKLERLRHEQKQTEADKRAVYAESFSIVESLAFPRGKAIYRSVREFVPGICKGT